MTPTPDKGHAYHQGETDIIVAKLDLLIKKLGVESQQQIQAPIYAMGFALHVRSLWQRWTLGEQLPRDP